MEEDLAEKKTQCASIPADWHAIYKYGQVIVTNKQVIQQMNKLGIGSMRIQNEGSILKRARGGKKQKGSDSELDMDQNLEQMHEDPLLLPSNEIVSNVTNVLYDLSLTEEEAVYLCLKGQLTVFDAGTGDLIPVDSLYQKFAESRGVRLFPIQYAVYSFFKDRK